MSDARSLRGLSGPGTFRRFLQVPDAGADGAMRDVCDGEGDILPLRISTSAVEYTGPTTTPHSIANKAHVDAAVTYSSPASGSVPVPMARILDDHVSLRSFYSGDPLDLISGVADAGPALRAAVAAAQAAGGMRLQLPKGLLTIRTPDPTSPNYGVLMLDVANFHMRGQGRGQTIITGSNDPGNNIGLLSMARQSRSRFEGFTLDGRRPALSANGTHVFRGQGVTDTCFVDLELYGKETGGYVFGFQNGYEDAFDSGFKNLLFESIWLYGSVSNDVFDMKNRQANNEGIKFNNIWLWVQGTDKAGLDLRGAGVELNNIHATMLGGDQVNAIRLRDDAIEGDNPEAQIGAKRSLLNNIFVVNKGATSGTGIVVDNERVSLSNVFCDDTPIGINATIDSPYTQMSNIQVRASGAYPASYGVLVAGDRSSLLNFSVEGFAVGVEIRGALTRASLGTLVGNETNLSVLNTATDARIIAVSSITPVTVHQADAGTNTAYIASPGFTRQSRANLDLGGRIAAQHADGTVNAGTARGASAVDLQVDRTVETQVASGLASAVLGGQRNTASGAYSVASGFQASTRGRFAGWAHSAGAGYQASGMLLSGLISGGGTTVRLTADRGAAAFANIFNSFAFASHFGRVMVMAVRNNTGAGGVARDAAAWDLTTLFSCGATFPGQFVVDAVGGSAANVNVPLAPNAGVRGTDPSAWRLTISADATLGGLNLTVTTNSGRDVECVARVEVVEFPRNS